MLGFTPDGADSGLTLVEEGEGIGFLMFEWPRRVSLKAAGVTVFTVKRKKAFTSSAKVVLPNGELLASIERHGRAYVARDPGGNELLRSQTMADGVLLANGHELIVRAEPVDRELIWVKFAENAPVLQRAALLGIAMLYEFDFRGTG